MKSIIIYVLAYIIGSILSGAIIFSIAIAAEEIKEKLSKQNTKLLALFIPILIAHIITMTIEPSYRSTPMCYIVRIVSTAYSIDYTVRKIKEYIED